MCDVGSCALDVCMCVMVILVLRLGRQHPIQSNLDGFHCKHLVSRTVRDVSWVL